MLTVSSTGVAQVLLRQFQDLPEKAQHAGPTNRWQADRPSYPPDGVQRETRVQQDKEHVVLS